MRADLVCAVATRYGFRAVTRASFKPKGSSTYYLDVYDGGTIWDGGGVLIFSALMIDGGVSSAHVAAALAAYRERQETEAAHKLDIRA